MPIVNFQTSLTSFLVGHSHIYAYPKTLMVSYRNKCL